MDTTLFKAHQKRAELIKNFNLKLTKKQLKSLGLNKTDIANYRKDIAQIDELILFFSIIDIGRCFIDGELRNIRYKLLSSLDTLISPYQSQHSFAIGEHQLAIKTDNGRCSFQYSLPAETNNTIRNFFHERNIQYHTYRSNDHNGLSKKWRSENLLDKIKS